MRNKYINKIQDISLIDAKRLRDERNMELVRFSDQKVNILKLQYDDLDVKVAAVGHAAIKFLRLGGALDDMRSIIDTTNVRVNAILAQMGTMTDDEVKRIRAKL